MRRHVQSHICGEEVSGIPPTTFDGATEIWFDDLEGLRGVFEATAYMDVIRPDEAKFLDLNRCELLLTTEIMVIP